MPELPEVEALAGFLRERLVGRAVNGVEIGAISALKTYDPPPTALGGLTVTAVNRHGKFLDLDVDGLHLVFHLARAGWLRWSDTAPKAMLKPGKSPLALRVRFTPHLDDPDDDSTPGFDLSEAGTRKRLAIYVVRTPDEVPGIHTLGPDPLDEAFTRDVFAQILGRNQQIKGLLRDQSVIAGVGNAYSDEVLHAAKMSPFAMAAKLSDEQITSLYEALQNTLRTAITAAAGKPAKELKDAKRAGLAVHARTGEKCPVCGDVVREVSFADSSLQYCATCQTGGKILADRRMSRLLK
ncbi:DNA-formamidopyrimidine glycosylase family protein [Kineosporia sp. NBRC 101731]|uniref:Fpg/Nei family DNA glycosylase n=1 Tax=Kineosporia sp. NBRC 101731 TaxID=3032199 RepID=UPI0024A09EB3|nr:DNA-formamidopyrimidine glycosylase family protein [Kineosporia sp. NBRC 101731]GLY26749.1 formamidopyrimidine-DNA glycosylase [Kineosporia sp. NBRC 101731]